MKLICSYCNSEFYKKRASYKFCSVSCVRQSKAIKNKECPNCKIPFRPKEPIQKYCSHSCAAIFNNAGRVYINNKKSVVVKKSKLQDWLDGRWNGSITSGNLSKIVREYLLEQAKYRCTRCGWAECSQYIKNKVPILTIDHIDGKSNNNTVDNLVVLCYNCHTLTPTFGSLNRGNGTRFTVGQQIQSLKTK